MTALAFAPAGLRVVALSSGVEVFWLICLGTVLFQVWRGWRSGLARQLSVVAGLLAGWLIGLTGGPAFFARLWSGKESAYLSVPLASMILGLIVYVVAILAGRLFFKRACDHPFGPTRLFLGGGGALVGFFLGLFGVWILIMLARLAGAVAQAEMEPPGPAVRGAPNHLADANVPELVRLRRSLESGLVGDLVRFTDPFPKEAYTDVTKGAQIALDPALQVRMFDTPSLRDFASDPKVIALRQNPAAVDALERHDYLSLLTNPAFRAVVNDPRLSRRLQKVNLTRLLHETVP